MWSKGSGNWKKGEKVWRRVCHYKHFHDIALEIAMIEHECQ